MSEAYKKAGVDQTLAVVLKTVKALSGNRQLGAFGGLFPLAAETVMNDPVLVAGTDGVGTKLLVAIAAQRHETIGIDLVAMCVNDILAQGARPQFFLDYLGLGHTDQNQVAAIMKGVVAGCQEADVALIGGETAEMPDMYAHGHYDLAGLRWGLRDRSALLDPSQVRTGDVLIGLPANGLRQRLQSGRDILFKQHHFSLDHVFQRWDALGEELRPTKIYVSSVLPLLQQQNWLPVSPTLRAGAD